MSDPSRDRKRRPGEEEDGSRKKSRSDHHHSSSSSSRSHHSSSSHRSSHSSHSHSHSSSSRRPAPSSTSIDVAKASKQFIPDAGSAGAAKKPKSEFLCEIAYTNTLPDIPFQPKLLKVYLPTERLTRYCAGSLENSLKIPFITDKMVGIPLDLIRPSQYDRPDHVVRDKLDPADESILPIFQEAGFRVQPTQEQFFQQGSSNWLRKQEFQSNNLYDVGIRTTGSAEQDQREFLRVEEEKKKLAALNTKERQIQLIETTFEQARLAPKHPDPSKGHLQAVEILEIFPEFGVEGGESYLQANNFEYNENAVNSDGEPLTEEELAELRKKARFNIEYAWTEFDYPPLESIVVTNEDGTISSSPPSQSPTANANMIPLIKSFTKKHHGLYLHDPANSLKNDSDEDESEAKEKDPNVLTKETYMWQREYVKVPTPLVQKENNYFFILRKREDGTAEGSSIHYAQYSERLKIGKRAQSKVDRSAQHDITSRPAKINVKYVKEFIDEGAEDADDEEEIEGDGEEEEEGEGEGEEEEEAADDNDEDEERITKKKSVKSEPVDEDEEDEGEDAAMGDVEDGDAKSKDDDEGESKPKKKKHKKEKKHKEKKSKKEKKKEKASHASDSD